MPMFIYLSVGLRCRTSESDKRITQTAASTRSKTQQNVEKAPYSVPQYGGVKCHGQSYKRSKHAVILGFVYLHVFYKTLNQVFPLLDML